MQGTLFTNSTDTANPVLIDYLIVIPEVIL
jgi:hypothetical protein